MVYPATTSQTPRLHDGGGPSEDILVTTRRKIIRGSYFHFCDERNQHQVLTQKYSWHFPTQEMFPNLTFKSELLQKVSLECLEQSHILKSPASDHLKVTFILRLTWKTADVMLVKNAHTEAAECFVLLSTDEHTCSRWTWYQVTPPDLLVSAELYCWEKAQESEDCSSTGLALWGADSHSQEVKLLSLWFLGIFDDWLWVSQHYTWVIW